jgi:CBS domain containing-hemolysin-like protein
LALATAVISFVTLVLLGEIVPKSLAYKNSRILSVFAALPIYFCIRLFAPLDALFKFVILEPVLRLSLGATRKIKALTMEEFRTLIDANQKQGLITVNENRLMTEVVQLGYLKVRHVMQPRVEMISCPETTSMETAQDLMREHNLTEIPVYAGTIDNIVGIVRLRQILLEPVLSVEKIVQRVHFVPEQKTVESLLQFFRQVKTDLAIVVDEYGGIAGCVRLGDIAEELFGDVESTKVFKLIEQTKPYEYRLAGCLNMRELVYLFGIQREDIRQSTIGGFVTALLGKIPSPGDTVHWKNLNFAVEIVQKNCIKTLMVTFNRCDKDVH